MSRPRFQIPIDQVIILTDKYGVAEAAHQLKVSRHWIYKTLKREGFKMSRRVQPIKQERTA
jgi:hypothetical protein